MTITRFLSITGIMLFMPFIIFAQSSRNSLNITPISGINNPVVTCVYQDSFGFTWFGSLNGVYRWDGNKAKHFYHNQADTNSMPSDQIISVLFEDSESNLWFGSLGHGAIKYDRFTDRFIAYPLNEKRPDLYDARWITRALQDAGGNLWGLGITNRLFKYDMENEELDVLELSLHDSLNNEAIVNNILVLLLDKSGSFLWLGTERGLYKYGINENEFLPVPIKQGSQKHPKLDNVLDIIQDSDSVLWICSPNAVFRYQIYSRNIELFLKLSDYSVGNEQEYIEEIIEDPQKHKQTVWVFTNSGILNLNKNTGDVIRYTIKNQEHFFESSEFISAKRGRFIDKNGFLWLATDNTGATFANLNISPFEQFHVGENQRDNSNNGATAFYIDSQNNKWIGTGFKGLYQFDNSMQLLNHFTHNPSDPNSLSNNFIYSIAETNEGFIWVGTQSGLNRLDVARRSCEHFLYEPINYEGNLPQVRIAEFFQDSTGRLWVGTSQGVYYSDNCDDEKVSFIQFDAIPYLFNLTQKIFNDKNGDIWFSTPTYHGLFRLTKGIDGNREILNYKRDPLSPESFITDGALSFFEDDKGLFWLATKEGLLKWNRFENSFERFNKENSLGANMIYWLEGDSKGNIWLSTEIGLIRFNPSLPDERKSKTFTFNDGLPFEKIYPYRFYKAADGSFYIGGQKGSGNGFYRFHPDSIVENTHVPPVFITNFNVHDKAFRLDSSIVVKKNITLTHGENFFSFEFAALDYTDPGKNQYACFLEGFENNWNYIGNRRFANYTGVPPGHYIFRVKGSNNDGYWNEEGASIAVTILKPPWRSWWANALYVIFIVGIITSIAWYYLKRQQLRRELFVEHMQKEKLEDVDRMKSRFFANISHEFRTPLTLILGPIKKLKAISTHAEMLEDLDIMQRNANRLQRLIDQLLSLSKIEAGQMKLQAGKGNIVEFVKGYLESFESAARSKGIKIYFKTSRLDIPLYFDRDKLEKILYNLFANAIKFTGEGGLINVAIASRETFISITVSDTGKGIEPEHLPFVFDRFYQADNFDTQFHEGSGIGLSLVKELVELHRGQITVDSKPGKGTTFIISLPAGTAHLEAEELAEIAEITEVIVSDEKNIEIPSTDPELAKPAEGCHSSRKKPLLLVVEDNADMRTYIRSIIEGPYLLAESDNGSQGLEYAIEHIPDMVVSDVMMPGMDGYKLCRKLKSDYRTSHIPVILLTARAGFGDKIEGLQTGADDFLIKPFEPMELLARIKNLIQQRQSLRERYRREFEHVRLKPEASMDALEIEFMEKARKVVGENISNPDFHISDFSRLMNMSRVQLHRKLIALFNLSATAFVRTYRLNEAARLFNSRLGNVAEVAYEVGFNNLSYFSKCFQKQFGMNPSEYLNQPHPEPEKEDFL